MKIERYKIPLIYITLGVLWIIVTDIALMLISGHQLTWNFQLIGMAKGILFVLGTGGVFVLVLRREEKRIVHNNEQYRIIYIGNSNPMWFYDPETFKFVSVNDAAVLRYGYSRKEFLSMTILDIRPQEDRDRVPASYQRMDSGLYESGNWRHLKKNGEVIYVHITSHKTWFMDKEMVMVMAQDTTEKFLYEQQLKTTGEMLSKINNPVIISNDKGKIVWVNPSYIATSGFSAAEVIGKDHVSILYSAATDLSLIEEMMLAVSRREVFVADMLNHDKLGREYWVTLNLSPIFDEEGHLEYYISVQNDLTEHKKREMVISIQEEKLRAVAWLNSHQIRKPVASILSLADLMKSADDEAEKAELLEMLSRCAQELDEIILEINAEASGHHYRP